MSEGLPNLDPPEAPQPPETGAVLRSREDWLTEVQRLEAQRADIEAAMGDAAHTLTNDRDFNFLLGRIWGAQQQLIAHTLEEGIQQIKDSQ